VVRPRLLELSEQIQKLATRLNKEEFSSALQQTFKEVTAHIKTKLENIKKQETDAILIAEQAASCLNFDKNILEFVEKVEESPHCNKVADILGLELVAFKMP
jgi:porphobilinogen deaminase